MVNVALLDMFTDVHDVHHVHSADDAFKAEVPRLRSGFRQQTLTPATAKEALAGDPEAPRSAHAC